MVQSKARRANTGMVEFPRFYGKARAPLKPLTEPPVIGGFDIEADAATADPYLICASLSDGKTFKKTLRNCQDVLNFLTQPSFQHSINGFWNIAYDSEGMLRFFPDFVKYLLSKNPEVYLTEDLRPATKEAWYYHIRVIPKKALFIRTVISPVNRFFDFAQFYDKERLSTVAKRILNDDKESFDASKSDIKQYFTNPEYYEKVRSYCLHDADLTQRLGAYLVKAVHTFLQTKNFTSRASLAGQYFLRNGYTVPQKMRFFFKWFLRTYWGGRFEMTKRGYIRDVFTSDLKSAYPKWLSELWMLTDDVELIQTKTDEVNFKCRYGAYKVSLQVPEDNYLGPIPVESPRSAGPIIYPVGSLEPQWLDKITLEYLSRKGYDFQIHEGVELYDASAKQLLKQPVERLFSIKENKKNDEGIRTTAKIMMNGAYGKSIELIDDIIGEIRDLDEALAEQLEIHKILQEGAFTTRHTGKFQAGAMFCPPYASDITAHTRIDVMEMAEYVGFENTVAIQTDSLSCINKPPKVQKGLGGWDPKPTADLTIGKPGFYQFQEAGNPGMADEWRIFNKILETKARGFGRINDITLSEYTVRRRISMKECASKLDFTNQNLIIEKQIGSNLNTDQKRTWDADLTDDDCRPWGRTIDSKPLIHKLP
jgi:hypothetical protein